MQAKSDRFEMRLEPDLAVRIDEWRDRQDGRPSRAEAMRRLVERALIPDTRVDIRDGEKLLFYMLRDIHKAIVKGKEEMDPEFISDAISGGHYWALAWQYSGIFHQHEDSKRSLSEVADVLDMWSFMEEAYEKLSAGEKKLIETQAVPLGKSITFPGFDGNNENEHMGIAQFLVDKMGRFSRFKGRSFNSHYPVIDSYRRMLRVFEPMRVSLIGHGLNAKQLIELLKARMA